MEKNKIWSDLKFAQVAAETGDSIERLKEEDDWVHAHTIKAAHKKFIRIHPSYAGTSPSLSLYIFSLSIFLRHVYCLESRRLQSLMEYQFVWKKTSKNCSIITTISYTFSSRSKILLKLFDIVSSQCVS